MDAKTMLKGYPLEFSHPENITIEIEKIVQMCNRDYVLLYKKEDDGMVMDIQYYRSEIYCPELNFAKAYWYFGLLWERYIIPLLNKK